LDAVRSSLANIKAHSFTVVDLQPRHKEGGVFVAFEFTASDEEAALNAIKAELRAEGEKQRLPSWGYDTHFWLVEGKPWIEVNLGHTTFARWAQVLRICEGIHLISSVFALTGRILERSVSMSSCA
jgi:hypothetical protein